MLSPRDVNSSQSQLTDFPTPSVQRIFAKKKRKDVAGENFALTVFGAQFKFNLLMSAFKSDFLHRSVFSVLIENAQACVSSLSLDRN